MAWMTHNPAFENPDRLVERFVVRHHEFETVLRVIRENTGPVNQHVLIIAPRGRGKTMLVRRAAIEILRDAELASSWFPIVFGEESYNVSTVGELWLEALLHLADATGDPRWQTAYQALRGERDERRLAEAARARLLDYADQQGKRLVLVVENLDTLIEAQLPEDEAWALRRVLLEEPRLMLLGTAVHRFPGVDQPDQPLFDLFKRVEIAPLDESGCQELWRAVTGHDIGPERAAAIRVLTGGSPRLLVLLAEFSDGRDLRTLLDDLAGLIDQHTDYFKHNIESLAPQQRRVFLALAELWAPSAAREVAEIARMDVSTTSAQLNRLEHEGRVEIAETRGRSHVYQVAERLYNIYYLMRRRGGVEGRVRALLDFIRHFYQPAEIPAVVGRIAAEACAIVDGRREEHLWLYQRFVEDRRDDHAALLELIRRSPYELFDLPDLPAEVRDLVAQPQLLAELIDGPSGNRWLAAAEQAVDAAFEEWLRTPRPFAPEIVKLARASLYRMSLTAAGVLLGVGEVDRVTSLEVLDPLREHWARGLALLAVPPNHASVDQVTRLARHAVSLAPGDPTVQIALGRALASHGATREEGVAVLLKCLELPLTSSFWASQLVEGLHLAMRFEEARAVADQALERWPDDDGLWSDRFELANHHGSQDEAERIGRAWFGRRPDSASSRSAFAKVLLTLGKAVEAVDLCRQIANEHPLQYPPHVNLAVALNDAGLVDDAIESLHRARGLDPAKPASWTIELGILLPQNTDRAEVVLAELAACSTRTDRTVWGALDALTRHAPAEWLDRACSWADRLQGDMPPPGTRARAARLHGRAGHLHRALALLAPLYDDAELVGRNLDAARDDAMRLAASGAAAETLDMLRKSASAPLLEPLIVALGSLVGEKIDAPVEVREVAEHVLVRIEGLAESGDPWRTDPRTIPIIRPS